MALANTGFGIKGVEDRLRNVDGVWFIGIGGVSMSSLAEMTLHRGIRVGGSDRTDGERLQRLRRLGAEIRVGDCAGIPNGYEAVVYTVAIAENNPQYVAARQAGIPCISRADYMGYLMHGYRQRIGIAGMHGKSTCTAMCAEILLRCGSDPTVLSGAELPSLGGSACRVGEKTDTVLFEACEYMDSFLSFCPNIAVVLNIGMDHVDYFHSMEQIRESFRRYAESVGRDGILIRNLDDPECCLTFARMPDIANVKTFSTVDSSADFFASEIRADHAQICFQLHERGMEPYPIKVGAVGRHNVYNALAAVAAARAAGVPPEAVTRALAMFRGASRRTEYRGTLNGCAVYDDYAHHPDEIRATLAGVRSLVPRGGRLICVYQPHTYSRTAGLFDAFSRAFEDADAVLLVNIYAARERNESGVTSEMLAKAVRKTGTNAISSGSLDRTAAMIPACVKPNDLLLVMGAGDIETLFDRLPIHKL